MEQRDVGYHLTLAVVRRGAIPEGFGGPYTAGATDIGTGIIYAVVFAALYGLETAVSPSAWTVDGWLEGRFP